MQNEIKEEVIRRLLEGIIYMQSALELVLEQYEIQTIDHLEKGEY